MFLKSVVNLTAETVIDILLIIYHILRSVIIFFIPNKFRSKSVEKNIILITGGGSGIGRELAIRFSKLGAIVVIWDISKPGLEGTVDAIKSINGIVFSYLCDITDKEVVYKTAAKVREDVGVVSILINNAGIVSGKDFLEIPDEKIIQTFNVNAISHFWLVKAFLPDMKKRNFGHLVSLASVAGTVGVSGLTDYCASKFAAIGFEESIRMELIRDGYDGIKSTVVCPYFINTGLFKGVYSRLLPILETEYVCEKIVTAILTNQSLLMLPRIMYLLLVMKSILPVDSFKRLYRIFGGDQMMSNGFEGRNGKVIYDSNANFLGLK